MIVAVLGASDKADRYSYKAVAKLLENGHKVYPIHPALESVQGLSVIKNIAALPEQIDTLTLYVNAQVSSAQAEQIIAAKPRRIIFNPGAENPDLMARATAVGIDCEQACTLVMLATKQF